MAWQLPQVPTAYRYTAIALSHSTSQYWCRSPPMNNVPQDYMCRGLCSLVNNVWGDILWRDTVHCDTKSVQEIQLFQLWELAFLLMEATFAVGSTTEEKYEQKSLCRVPTLTRSSDWYWNGMGVTAMFECMTKLGFTIDMWPHSEIWLVSNSLNSCKLPGQFSYDLGMRLHHPCQWSNSYWYCGVHNSLPSDFQSPSSSWIYLKTWKCNVCAMQSKPGLRQQSFLLQHVCIRVLDLDGLLQNFFRCWVESWNNWSLRIIDG